MCGTSPHLASMIEELDPLRLAFLILVKNHLAHHTKVSSIDNKLFRGELFAINPFLFIHLVDVFDIDSLK